MKCDTTFLAHPRVGSFLWSWFGRRVWCPIEFETAFALILFVVLSCESRGAADEAATPADVSAEVQYTIEGILNEYNIVDGTLSSDFKVVVKGKQWSVTTTPWPQFDYLTNGSVINRSPINGRLLSCDGTNSYYVSFIRGDDTASDDKGEAEFSSGIVPIRGGMGQLSVWYAYASHTYLRERQGKDICPIALFPKRPLPTFKPRELKLLGNPPGLPSVIVIRRDIKNASQQQFREERFVATAITNVAGHTFPSKVQVEFDDPFYGSRWYRIEVIARSVKMQAENISFKPVLNGPYRIHNRDTVVQLTPSRPAHGLTLITNKWPSSEAYEAQIKLLQAASKQRKPKPLFTALLVAAVLVGPLLLWFSRFSSRNNQKRLHQDSR